MTRVQDILQHWESFDTSIDAFAAFFEQMLPVMSRSLGIQILGGGLGFRG
jgi:hypothetical protein